MIASNKKGSIEQELRENGFYAGTTFGVSMKPMLRNGMDQIMIVPPIGDIKKNDVVLYRNHNGKCFLHRVIKVSGDKCIIRGDNLFYNEEKNKSEIIGKMLCFWRKNRKVTDDSLFYKVYIRYIRLSYPLRFIINSVKTGLYSITHKNNNI